MKKFLICLLVVAIALLGFTGCPSPTSDDDSGASGPVDSVDDSVPGAADLRELTHTALPLAGTLDSARVLTIFTIVDEIEADQYGSRAQGNYPTPGVRAAENYADYDYYDDSNEVTGYVYKAQNYPVYYATYLEDIQSWSRILPDGDLAPGDTLDRTLIQHYSVEWPELILKSGGLKDDVNLLIGSLPTLNGSPYYGTEVDVVIDGKSVSFLDSTYTNEYTKISERLAGGASHWDTYFTRDYDYSYAIRKAYSIDTGVNYITTSPNSPGAFKILYELIVEEADTIDLMVEDNTVPVYPVYPPAVITAAAFDNPIGFTINLEILGKKATATGVGAEESLLSLSISTWNDLIAASKKGTFARTGSLAGNVDDALITWILKDAPVLPGAAAVGSANVQYNSYASLPTAVKDAIQLAATPTP